MTAAELAHPTGNQDPAAAHTRHFAVLDGMRGTAALCVVALHFSNQFDLGGPFIHAHMAVDLFFMLSGLVIANAYETKLLSTMSLYRFVSIRIVRLYPMVFLGVILGSLVLLASVLVAHVTSLMNVVCSIMAGLILVPSPFIRNFRPWAFAVNNPLWSMSAEIVINIVYAAFCRVLNTAALTVLILVSGLALLYTGYVHKGLDVGFTWDTYPLSFVRAVAPFFIGVLMWRLLRNNKLGGKWAHLAPILGLIFLVAPVPQTPFYEPISVLILFPALLTIGMLAPPMPILDRIWIKLGAISYPLYVLHYPIITAGENAAKILHAHGLKADLILALTVAAVATATGLALTYYDAPSRRWLQSVLSPAKAGGAGHGHARLAVALFLAVLLFVAGEVLFPGSFAGPAMGAVLLILHVVFNRRAEAVPSAERGGV